MYYGEPFAEITAEPVEVMRYPTSAGERRVVVRRGAEGLEVLDEAVGVTDDMWWVDCDCTDPWELAAFLVDYRSKGILLDRCPMSREGISADFGDWKTETTLQLFVELAERSNGGVCFFDAKHSREGGRRFVDVMRRSGSGIGDVRNDSAASC